MHRNSSVSTEVSHEIWFYITEGIMQVQVEEF